MSFYEGKNCFRTAFTQRPVYSGQSNIAAARVDFPIACQAQATTNDGETAAAATQILGTIPVELVIMANNNVLNISHRTSGQLLCAREVGLDDDIILHVDCCVKNNDAKSASAAAPAATTTEEDEAEGRVLMYIACSTRSLQIYVFALRASATLPDPNANKRRSAFRQLQHQQQQLQQRFDVVMVPLSSGSSGDQQQHQVPLSVSLTTVKSWTADQSAVSCLKFSPKTYHLASGSADGGLKVWSVLNHFLTHQFRGTGGVVTALSFLEEDESLLVAGTFEGYLSVIDFGAKRVLASGRKHSASVEAISVVARNNNNNSNSNTASADASTTATTAGASGDEVLIITASRDRTVTVYEAKSLKSLRSIALGHPLLACSFVSPFVGVYGCESGLVGAFSVSPHTFGVVVFAVKDAPQHGTEEEHSVRAIGFIPRQDDNKKSNSDNAVAAAPTSATTSTNATSGGDKKSKKSEAAASRRRQRDSEGEAATTKATKAATSTSTSSRHSLLPETVLILDASYRLFALSAHVPSPGSNGGTLSAPVGARFDCDQTDILNFDQVMDVKLFPRKSLSATTAAVESTTTAISTLTPPHKEELVIATNARDCYVTAAANSSRLRGVLQGHSDIVVAIDIDASGQRILTASKDMHCRVWCSQSLRCLGVSSDGIHSAELTGAKFVPQNAAGSNTLDLACTVSFDSVLAVWDLSDTQQQQQKQNNSSNSSEHFLTCPSSIAGAHDGPTYCLAIAPNGQFVATGGKDKTVGLFSLKGKRLAKEGSLTGHRRTVSCLAFSPVDRVLVSGSNDGAVRVWSLSALSCIRTMQADNIPILQLGFFNRGTQLVTSNADGVTRFWATSAGECVAVTTPHADRSWALCVREHEEREIVFDEAGDGDDEDEDVEGDNNATSTTRIKTRTYVLTGGADGTLVCQEDFTDEQVEALRAERQETTAKEQQLRNTMREGEFGEAFKLALTLNHPRHLRGVLVAWMAKTASRASAAAKLRGENDDDDDDDGNTALDNGEQEDDTDDDTCEREVSEIVAGLSNQDLHRLFTFARLWLTNAKHSGAASLVVAATLKGLHPTRLEKMAAFVEVAEALHSYSKRHLARLRRSQDQLYFLEFLTKGQVGSELAL